jgi:DNA primase
VFGAGVLSLGRFALGVYPLEELPVYTGSDETKDRIRQSVDLVDLVGEQIELRRQGRNFVGLCPWHADTKPSLQVNPDRQTWKCWVCDLGGDIFSFVMQREGIGFREAVGMLAERAGVSLKPASQQPAPRPGSPDDKKTLYEAMAWAAEQYHRYLLESPEAKPGREYLEQRKIDHASIKLFQIGFVPNRWDWLTARAQGTAFTPQVLQAVGLAMQSERTGGWFDRFRGRVMFPICDPQRRPIAVGGRILPEYADEKNAKYINSPETRLFSKSDQLYGLHLARDTVSRQREVIVMEGYTDVVIARQFGVEQAVAVLGTALGARHIRLLRRFADRITLLLDGDAAGQRRASEILDLFVTNQIDLRIVTLPNNLDPCDYLIQNGRESLMELVTQAPDAWEYKIRLETANLDPVRDTHRAHMALENLLGTLARMPRAGEGNASATRLLEQQLLNRLARDFRLDETDLRRRLSERRRQMMAKPAFARQDSADKPAQQPTAKPSLEPIERDLFELMLQQPESVQAVLEEINVTQLKSATARQLYQIAAELVEREIEPTVSALLLAIDDPAMKNLIVAIDESATRKAVQDRELALRELLHTFARRTAEEQLSRQQAALESDDLDEQQKLDMLLDLLRARQELSENP